MILTFIYFMLMWGAFFTGLIGLLILTLGNKSSSWINASAFCFFTLAVMAAFPSINEKALVVLKHPSDAIFCILGSLIVDLWILISIKVKNK